jgi:hypothetical protein
MSAPLAGIFADAATLVEAGWCKGVSAQDADGKPVRFDKPEAVRFCAVGALTVAAYKAHPSESKAPNVAAQLAYAGALSHAQAVLRARGYHKGLTTWNDENIQPNVVELLRDCAEAANKESGR